MQSLAEINHRFEHTWKLISGMAEQQITHPTERALRKLKHCLKWSIAYSLLQSEGLRMIRPFHQNPLAVIKWFWIEYSEQHFLTNSPPTLKEFMEWYCNSDTIREDRIHAIPD